MMGLIDSEGNPTTEFMNMVNGLLSVVDSDRAKNHLARFYCLLVRRGDGHVENWGMFDTHATPREDWYLLTSDRFYAAIRIYGQSTISAFGIMTLENAISGVAMPVLPTPPADLMPGGSTVV